MSLDLIEINNVVNDIKKDIAYIQKWVADKEITLEDRWSVFKSASSLLPVKSYYFNVEFGAGESKHVIELYDIGYEKYQTVDLTELVQMIEDSEEYPWGLDEYPKEDIDDLKETIMQSGYGSFVYDW